jgi:hypothetical protein
MTKNEWITETKVMLQDLCDSHDCDRCSYNSTPDCSRHTEMVGMTDFEPEPGTGRGSGYYFRKKGSDIPPYGPFESLSDSAEVAACLMVELNGVSADMVELFGVKTHGTLANHQRPQEPKGQGDPS